MAEEITAQQEGTQADAQQEPRTFTQDEVNRIVAERVARVKATPPDDYEALKAKAAEYDKAQDAAKSELQKALERAQAAEGELQQLREQQKRAAEVTAQAKAYGVDADVLAMMAGDVEENARMLKSKMPQHYASDKGEQARIAGADSPAEEFARWLHSTKG